MKVEVPTGLEAGEPFAVTASDGHEVFLQVPSGLMEGDCLVYAEVVVPTGADAGKKLTVVVADPELEVQVFDIVVPDDYQVGDVMLVVLDGATHDWDAAWSSFRALQRKDDPPYARGWAAVLEQMTKAQLGGWFNTAQIVAATLLAAYVLLCYALHSSGGLILTSESDLSLSMHHIADLNPITQWQLRSAL